MLRRKQKLLFEDCAEQWLHRKRETAKQSTVTTYSRILEAQILPVFGKMQVKEITKEKVKEFVKQKEEVGRVDGNGGLSAKSCKDMLTVLTAVLDFTEEKYGVINVMKKVKSREIVSAGEPIRIETLTEGESRKLTERLFEQGDGEAIGILLSLYTGIRLGEVCALQWGNIDLETGILKVRATMARVLVGNEEKDIASRTRLIFTVPKTKNSIRDVPIPDFIMPLLWSQKSKNGFLLTGTEEYMDMRTFQNHFKRIVRECGLREIHFHCLRHTFATNCINLDFDIKTVSEILGHSNTAVTWERYVHSSMDRKQMLMRKLSEKVFV